MAQPIPHRDEHTRKYFAECVAFRQLVRIALIGYSTAASFCDSPKIAVKTMKIGILTLPLHTNYGGILQAWALQTVLQRMGHDVEVFGIKPQNGRAWYLMPLVWGSRIIRKCIGRYQSDIFNEYWQRKEEQHKFKRVKSFANKNINLQIIDSLGSLSEFLYDGIIVGSDQIWREVYIRYLWRCENPESAFLYHLRDTDLLKIAYGASFGIDKWTFSQMTTQNIKQALSAFESISVRETSAVGLLKENVDIDSTHVCDPTMLITAEEYKRQFKIKDGRNSGIVSYILDPSDLSKALVDKISSNTNQSASEINVPDTAGIYPSVERWVEMIATSKMVVTDSFHGCIFSLIFRKPLIFIENSSRGNARFQSLIETFGIADNIVRDIKDFDLSKSYSLPKDIDNTVETIVSRSMTFLRQNLVK